MSHEQHDEGSAECQWVLAELSERQPTPEVSRRLEAHLADCPTCRDALAWDRRLAGVLKGESFPPASGSIQQHVHALLERRRTVWWRGIAAAFAVAAILSTCGVILLWDGKIYGGRDHKPAMSAAANLVPADSLDDLMVLVAEPPVPSLSRSQSGWLAVLVQVSEGDL